MKKTYLDQNVWDATQERLRIIFERFDNICVSFSGGKDSGLLLNLVLDYRRTIGDTRKIGVFHQDFEAQFQHTTDFVTRMFLDNADAIEPFWECLPKASRTAVTNYQIYWYPWDDEMKHLWVRPMPDLDHIIHCGNNPFDFYRHKMTQEELYEKFGPWYHSLRSGRSICLLGLRAAESLNRHRAYTNNAKKTFGGIRWTTKAAGVDGLYVGYPLYDWTAEDVWIANGKRGYDYNTIYDLFHAAGLSLHQMRVASPFHEAARHSLNLYRVIDPAMWAKICGRVHGANFAAIYGGTKAIGAKSISLPEGHTWKSYLDFLLNTLPVDTAAHYREKFQTSIEFWRKRGGVLSEETIAELEAIGLKFEVAGLTNYKTDKQAVRFSEYPDSADVKEFQSVPSYKRMCICILKNDHMCKYMGFSQTKAEAEKRKSVMEKYKDI